MSFKVSLPSNICYTYMSALTLKRDIGFTRDGTHLGFTEVVPMLNNRLTERIFMSKILGISVLLLVILVPAYIYYFLKLYCILSVVSVGPHIEVSCTISRSPFISVCQYIMASCNISISPFMSARHCIMASCPISRSPFISVRQCIMASGNISKSSFISVCQGSPKATPKIPKHL